MRKVEEIVTDKELDNAYGNSNFGSLTKREVLKYGVLKVASGYYQGHTSKSIAQELGLVKKGRDVNELTRKGKDYLWLAFEDGSNF